MTKKNKPELYKHSVDPCLEGLYFTNPYNVYENSKLDLTLRSLREQHGIKRGLYPTDILQIAIHQLVGLELPKNRIIEVIALFYRNDRAQYRFVLNTEATDSDIKAFIALDKTYPTLRLNRDATAKYRGGRRALAFDVSAYPFNDLIIPQICSAFTQALLKHPQTRTETLSMLQQFSVFKAAGDQLFIDSDAFLERQKTHWDGCHMPRR